MKEHILSVEIIDDILPQTQCGLCGFNGCRPYAQAMVHHGEAINKCLPGGIKTLVELAELFQVDPSADFADMEKKAKPAVVAKIRESDCIGCTKCIDACPVDAIIGAAKQMHTILTDACTGCELCLSPCPVDCIDLIPIPQPDSFELKNRAKISKERYQRHQTRLANNSDETNFSVAPESVDLRKQEILAAMERVKHKSSKTGKNP